MEKANKNKLLVLCVLFVVILSSCCCYFSPYNREPFMLGSGAYPKSIENPILNSYPQTHNKEGSSKGIATVYKDDNKCLGSFEQTTNNMRYYDTPDFLENCSPMEVCNVLYGKNKMYEKKNVNEVLPLREVPYDADAVRVGYYNANK